MSTDPLREAEEMAEANLYRQMNPPPAVESAYGGEHKKNLLASYRKAIEARVQAEARASEAVQDVDAAIAALHTIRRTVGSIEGDWPDSMEHLKAWSTLTYFVDAVQARASEPARCSECGDPIQPVDWAHKERTAENSDHVPPSPEVPAALLAEGGLKETAPESNNRPAPADPPAEHREGLGRRVREVWVKWASEQPSPKPSWLAPWEELSEPEREVDRRIGAALWGDGYRDGMEYGFAASAYMAGAAPAGGVEGLDPRMDHLLRTLAAMECDCDEAYTARGRHEPNVFHYDFEDLIEDARAALADREAPRGGSIDNRAGRESPTGAAPQQTEEASASRSTGGETGGSE